MLRSFLFLIYTLLIRGWPWLLAYTDTPFLGDLSGVRGDSLFYPTVWGSSGL